MLRDAHLLARPRISWPNFAEEERGARDGASVAGNIERSKAFLIWVRFASIKVVKPILLALAADVATELIT